MGAEGDGAAQWNEKALFVDNTVCAAGGVSPPRVIRRRTFANAEPAATGKRAALKASPGDSRSSQDPRSGVCRLWRLTDMGDWQGECNLPLGSYRSGQDGGGESVVAAAYRPSCLH